LRLPSALNGLFCCCPLMERLTTPAAAAIAPPAATPTQSNFFWNYGDSAFN
jgi:hypothetical protein